MILLIPLPCLAIPAEKEPPPDLHLSEPKPTTILVRVVAHGSMVPGKEMGDQNQIMRTPRLMGGPLYSSRASASFTTTLELTHPTLVDIAAEGPLAYPTSAQRVTTRTWLIPGQDMTHDGIVLALYGYIVRIKYPQSGEPLIVKDDVMLRATIRTLSGALVRPHGDWDSR